MKEKITQEKVTTAYWIAVNRCYQLIGLMNEAARKKELEARRSRIQKALDLLNKVIDRAVWVEGPATHWIFVNNCAEMKKNLMRLLP